MKTADELLAHLEAVAQRAWTYRTEDFHQPTVRGGIHIGMDRMLREAREFTSKREDAA